MAVAPSAHPPAVFDLKSATLTLVTLVLRSTDLDEIGAELERRWNEALQAVHSIEGEIAARVAVKPPPLGERERQQLMQLGADLELAW